MGQQRPQTPDISGDNSVLAPRTGGGDASVLASERGTDKTRRIETDASGNVYVNVAAGSLTVTAAITASHFGEATAVPSNTLTTILTHTAAVAEKLNRVEVSGTNIAEYQIFVDGVLQGKKWTNHGGPLSETFQFDNGLDIAVGQVLLVRVVHPRSSVGNFTANATVKL